MELMIQRVTGKVRKQFIFLLIIPIVLGLVGYVLPVQKATTSYTANATLSLGNYNDQDLNDSKTVITLLTTPPFYEQNLKSLWSVKQNNLLNNLTVTRLSENTITISYTDSSQEEAVGIVNQVTSAFMKMDQDNFNKRENMIRDSISALENKNVGPNAVVDQQRFLYQQKTALLDMKPAVLIKSPDEKIGSVTNKTLSSKDRAVLGVLLGFTFIFLWLVVPEFVRKQ